MGKQAAEGGVETLMKPGRPRARQEEMPVDREAHRAGLKPSATSPAATRLKGRCPVE